eukprot:SAG11_NODE_1110_length_5824_cov_7.340087_5_plen_52_part_00
MLGCRSGWSHRRYANLGVKINNRGVDARDFVVEPCKACVKRLSVTSDSDRV